MSYHTQQRILSLVQLREIEDQRNIQCFDSNGVDQEPSPRCSPPPRRRRRLRPARCGGGGLGLGSRGPPRGRSAMQHRDIHQRGGGRGVPPRRRADGVRRQGDDRRDGGRQRSVLDQPGPGQPGYARLPAWQRVQAGRDHPAGRLQRVPGRRHRDADSAAAARRRRRRQHRQRWPRRPDWPHRPDHQRPPRRHPQHRPLALLPRLDSGLEA